MSGTSGTLSPIEGLVALPVWAAGLAPAGPVVGRPVVGMELRGSTRDFAARRNAVLYARVSSKEQERGGFSIPAQRELLRGHARKHGFVVVEEFTDVETAGKAGRTAFGAMLRYLRRRPRCRAMLTRSFAAALARMCGAVRERTAWGWVEIVREFRYMS